MSQFSNLEVKLEHIVNKLLIGGLIITCIGFVFLISFLTDSNAKLNQAYQDAYNQFDMYAVPETDLRMDVLDSMRERLYPFSWMIAQKMLTFTPKSYDGQQEDVKKFLTPNMLAAFNASEDVEKHKRFRQSNYQIFTTDKNPVIEVTGKRSVNGGLVRNVTIVGTLKTVDTSNRSKGVYDKKQIEIFMEVEETSISQTNPYGFVVAKYQTGIVDKE